MTNETEQLTVFFSAVLRRWKLVQENFKGNLLQIATTIHTCDAALPTLGAIAEVKKSSLWYSSQGPHLVNLLSYVVWGYFESGHWAEVFVKPPKFLRIFEENVP